MGQMFTRIIVGVILGFLTMTVHRAVPKGNIQLFYAAEYVLNATFVFFVLVYVGKIGTCGGENRKEDDKRKSKKRN